MTYFKKIEEFSKAVEKLYTSNPTKVKICWIYYILYDLNHFLNGRYYIDGNIFPT